MQDDLGDRMKGSYEDRTRYLLPRRTYTIIRLDGKSFHTYTKGLKKPFDRDLFEDIDNAIIAMLSEIQGAVFAYTQSDEISILLTDFATPQTSAWFDGNSQKITSVSASIMTAEFNLQRYTRALKIRDRLKLNNENVRVIRNLAYFDARVFTIPDRIEVMNYFIWRNQDCSRNSVSMVAQSNFSHRELQGKTTPNMHEMLHAEGINWAADYTDREKNGGLIVKETYEVPLSDINKGRPDAEKLIGMKSDGLLHETVTRSRWVANGAWKFTEDKDKLLKMIPKYE
jgi:tRNA(His) 5'-end guanylyltransferase